MLQIHVALSLIGMVSGFVVLYGLLGLLGTGPHRWLLRPRRHRPRCLAPR